MKLLFSSNMSKILRLSNDLVYFIIMETLFIGIKESLIQVAIILDISLSDKSFSILDEN